MCEPKLKLRSIFLRVFLFSPKQIPNKPYRPFSMQPTIANDKLLQMETNEHSKGGFFSIHRANFIIYQILRGDRDKSKLERLIKKKYLNLLPTSLRAYLAQGFLCLKFFSSSFKLFFKTFTIIFFQSLIIN